MLSEWMEECEKEPARPEDIVATLRQDSEMYSRFLFYIVRRVEGKRKFDNEAARKSLSEMVHIGKEAFILLVYENGYDRWTWVGKNGVRGVDLSSSSDASDDGRDVKPSYKYTQGANVTTLTRRNGGWSSQDRLPEIC